MAFLARNSFRALRAAPRPRTFTAAAEHPALTKYLAEDKALRHHAAGQTHCSTLLSSLTLSLLVSTEASDLWRKIRFVTTRISKTRCANRHLASTFASLPVGVCRALFLRPCDNPFP